MDIIWENGLHSMAIVQQPFANGSRTCKTQRSKVFRTIKVCRYVPREQLTDIS